jgi:hypothetical protein
VCRVGLEEAEKTGLVPAELLYEAFRHHVLLRDGVVADGESPDVGDAALSAAASFSSSSSSSLLVEEDQKNPRLRRRKYHTYFLWDPSWHGQNIQIEVPHTTRHDTTRHDTTRHDTTRHDTTRHAPRHTTRDTH